MTPAVRSPFETNQDMSFLASHKFASSRPTIGKRFGFKEIDVTVFEMQNLPGKERDAWRRIQESNPELINPFFRVEFSEDLAKVRPNVMVAVLKVGDTTIGFWPYQEIKPGIAIPVGEKIGCMHGIICSPDLKIKGASLAKRCGLKSWKFDHLLASQNIFSEGYFETLESPFMDLGDGYVNYIQNLKDNGHSGRKFLELGRKSRKLAKDHGAIRFEIDCDDDFALECLIQWKRDQMDRTKRVDLFVQSPWIESLIKYSMRRKSDAFRGVMSVLYLNDDPISVHFGFRSNGYLHGIFFAYDQQYTKYSPGMLLVLNLAQHANDIGITRIDMGKGAEGYKNFWKSDSTTIAVGRYETNPILSFFSPRAYQLKRKISVSKFGPRAKMLLGSVQRFKHGI